MMVYIKNQAGQQTVRDLRAWDAIKMRIYLFMKYTKENRPIVKFLV